MSIASSWRRFKERYRLVGNKCETCNTYYFPPRKICPKCRRKGKLVEVKFSGRGEIYSFTEVEVAPQGYEEQTPYVLALIKLEEGPIVLGQIVDVRRKDVKIGDKVEMVFRKIREDNEAGLIHYGFKFRLVGK